MKIELSKRQYRHLLGLVYLGDWVLHAHDERERADTRHYRDVVQKLFAAARLFESEDLVEHTGDGGRYVPSGKLEEGLEIRRAIDEYDAQTFWRELVDRLAARDLERDVEPSRLQAMEFEEYVERLAPYEERYQVELEQHGVDRLDVRDT